MPTPALRSDLESPVRPGAALTARETLALFHSMVSSRILDIEARVLKAKYGVSAMDVAKCLLDYGIHPPTVYFPLIVQEALMVEPTETETRETLDEFVEVLREIIQKARENPEHLHEAPHSTPVRRLDEVRAARHPVLRWPIVDSGKSNEYPS